MGAKRKSGGGGDTKTPKSLKVKAKDAEKLSLSETYGPQMKLFETWWPFGASECFCCRVFCDSQSVVFDIYSAGYYIDKACFVNGYKGRTH